MSDAFKAKHKFRAVSGICGGVLAMSVAPHIHAVIHDAALEKNEDYFHEAIFL